MSEALEKLSQMLAAHYGKAPIIINDEYDTPIQEGYSKDFYDEIIGFMRNFFSGAFKDNNVFATDFTEIFGSALGEPLNAFFQKIENIWNSIKNIFGGIIDFITGVFSGNWEKAWNGVKDIFAGIFELLGSIIKAPLNGVIGLINGLVGGIVEGINFVINALNGLSFEVPEWVPSIGGATMGFSIPKVPEMKIPYLATGAVISPNAPFMAMLGDQRNGRNLEAPEGLIRQIMREEMAEIGVNVTFEVEGNESQIFKVTQKQARMYTKRTGKLAYY